MASASSILSNRCSINSNGSRSSFHSRNRNYGVWSGIIESDEWRIAKVGLDVGVPENAQHLGWKYSAIPRSEITRVELKKGLFRKGVRLNIITSQKEYKWRVVGLVPEQKDAKLEDYENVLRREFQDKLSVRK